MSTHQLSKEMLTLEDDLPFLHRDISWLSFNYRVLQEAKDPTVPLFERIKFLAIYSSNLDEFFRVRMANHRNLLRVGKKTKRELEISPKETVKEIQQIVNEQQIEFNRIFQDEIIPELKNNRIFILRRLELNPEQLTFIEEYFQEFMLPYVQPVLLVKNKIRPFLNNAALYLAVVLQDKFGNPGTEFAIVKIPSDHLPRFIELPATVERKDLIMLDDIVRHNLTYMFPGYDIVNSYSVKLTRDAELYIDDEFSGDLIQKIKSSLAKRHVGPASRFVYDREMPADLLAFLMEAFDLEKYDILEEGRYHNNFDFFKFPDFGLSHLKNPPLPPIAYPAIEDNPSLFKALSEGDHLIHVPYHSYESVIRFFEEAARDPQVTHIKIIQYRVAKKSRIMDALMQAVKAGKQVSVFVEVKARFDEEANLVWGEKLEKAGVNVHYSLPGIKVHSKVALVRRVESSGFKMYAFFSTGNFNEDTSKVYSDFGLFTADHRLINEAVRLFGFLETGKQPQESFQHLLVGKFNLRDQLLNLIEFEIAEAKAGRTGHIVLKMNSLQDQEMIRKLYEASQTGVNVQLIIRGICCLVPGLPGVSERIKAISIVDRYLEHARVFIFHHGGKNLVYLSSADWMVRNLSHRIETAFPVYHEPHKKEIIDIIYLQWSDNVKARSIDGSLENPYHKEGTDVNIRSQLETYYYLKRKAETF